ncbi:MAG: DUF502 domain-containing protein [Hyphomicrobiales bacterium]
MAKKNKTEVEVAGLQVGTKKKPKASARIRNYFLTGLVIAAPISITIYLTWAFVSFVDVRVKPLIPAIYNPDNYLPFSVPGVGLIVAILVLTLLGFFTANYLGRSVIAFGQRMLFGMPLIRNVYSALKQIFETVLSQQQKSFQKAGIIEYPRKGLFAVVFISTEALGEVKDKLEGSNGDKMISVFLPTTPNPTSGFLLFVKEKDIQMLDMSVEDAAKLVISAGLVAPNSQNELEALAEEAKDAAE